MAKADITAERLREVFHYDPTTGIFTRRRDFGSRIRAGEQPGSISKMLGYRQIGIGNFNFFAHRLAWLYVHGVWPSYHIDHIDGNKLNNAIANLRDVTRSVNQQNLKRAQSNSETGLLGVVKHKGFFTARIYSNGRSQHLGCFPTPEQAHAAYLAAKRAHHPGCTI